MSLFQCSKIGSPTASSRGLDAAPATRAAAPPKGAGAPKARTSTSSWSALQRSLSRAWYGDAELIAAHAVFACGERVPGGECFVDDVAYWSRRLSGLEGLAGADVASALEQGVLDRASPEAPCAPSPVPWGARLLTVDGWDANRRLGRRLRRSYCGLVPPRDAGRVAASALATSAAILGAQAVLEGVFAGDVAPAGRPKVGRLRFAEAAAAAGKDGGGGGAAPSPGTRLARSLARHGDARAAVDDRGLAAESEALREALAPFGGALAVSAETCDCFLLGASLRARGDDAPPPGLPVTLRQRLVDYGADVLDDVFSRRDSAVEALRPLADELLANLASAKALAPGKKVRRLFLYGGDVLVLLALHRALSVFPSRTPDADSPVVFELYDWQQALHVRLLLADVPVAIPGVDYATTLDGIALCRLEDLDARLRDLDAAATAARDHGDE